MNVVNANSITSNALHKILVFLHLLLWYLPCKSLASRCVVSLKDITVNGLCTTQMNCTNFYNIIVLPVPYFCVYIQAIHKRMVRFQKLTRNLFLILQGHNVHRQQRQLSKFLMRYQQFASHAYWGGSFQDGVTAGKGFLCAPF